MYQIERIYLFWKILNWVVIWRHRALQALEHVDSTVDHILKFRCLIDQTKLTNRSYFVLVLKDLMSPYDYLAVLARLPHIVWLGVWPIMIVLYVFGSIGSPPLYIGVFVFIVHWDSIYKLHCSVPFTNSTMKNPSVICQSYGDLEKGFISHD